MKVQAYINEYLENFSYVKENVPKKLKIYRDKNRLKLLETIINGIDMSNFKTKNGDKLSEDKKFLERVFEFNTKDENNGINTKKLMKLLSKIFKAPSVEEWNSLIDELEKENDHLYFYMNIDYFKDTSELYFVFTFEIFITSDVQQVQLDDWKLLQKYIKGEMKIEYYEKE